MARKRGKSIPFRDRRIESGAIAEIAEYFSGSEYRFGDLTQEEAYNIASFSQGKAEWQIREIFPVFINKLKEEGKSPGARYIAARILSGAKPDLRQLTQEWFVHRNIKRALYPQQWERLGLTAGDLRRKGISGRREAQEFYQLYIQLNKRAVNIDVVVKIICTPNYRKLPIWVKNVLAQSNDYIAFGEEARVGNIWRLIDCAKAWKHAPDLPKNLAEKVGRLSVKSRILARWAWDSSYKYQQSRAERAQEFWEELRRLQRQNIFDLVNEWGLGQWYSIFNYNRLRNLSEIMLGLPYGYLSDQWGRHKEASHYLKVLAVNESVSQICLNLFGSAGKATVQAFFNSNKAAWKWASVLCDRNPDAAQKILKMEDLIEFEIEAIDFLKSLPMQSRIRLLGTTTFKYRGTVNPVTNDHVRDTGYLWKNIQGKPDLGRVRCWFSVHETLAAAFIKELPDEELPIPSGWERVNGLSSVDGTWTIEIPQRVATLKYYGEVLKNCVGGYGPVIKSGRSVIFVVRESMVLTHCVEVCNKEIKQFYRSRNQEADPAIKKSVCAALYQAKLII